MKLFIPGPTEVNHKVLEAMSSPMIYHRSGEFKNLFQEIVGLLQQFLKKKNMIFLSTSSVTGLMEAAVRNCVNKQALFLNCGAFSERWKSIALSCGKEIDSVDVSWGKGIQIDKIQQTLKNNNYEAVFLVHNESSTGVMNHLEAIANVLKHYPETLFIIDTVSSAFGTNIEVDTCGIDVCIFGVQKALAVPPGMAIATISEKALAKAALCKNRGYYFDFIEAQKNFENGFTTTTPSISHCFALRESLLNIHKEGLERRIERHLDMASFTRNWAQEYFDIFTDKDFLSPTITCVKNTRNINLGALNRYLEEHGFMIANGYGKIKDKTFRIGHMGEHTLGDVQKLLELITKYVKK